MKASSSGAWGCDLQQIRRPTTVLEFHRVLCCPRAADQCYAAAKRLEQATRPSIETATVPAHMIEIMSLAVCQSPAYSRAIKTCRSTILPTPHQAALLFQPVNTPRTTPQ